MRDVLSYASLSDTWFGINVRNQYVQFLSAADKQFKLVEIRKLFVVTNAEWGIPKYL